MIRVCVWLFKVILKELKLSYLFVFFVQCQSETWCCTKISLIGVIYKWRHEILIPPPTHMSSYDYILWPWCHLWTTPVFMQRVASANDQPTKSGKMQCFNDFLLRKQTSLVAMLFQVSSTNFFSSLRIFISVSWDLATSYQVLPSLSDGLMCRFYVFFNEHIF